MVFVGLHQAPDEGRGDRVEKTGPVSTMSSVQTLFELVVRQAEAGPERPALIAPGRPALDYRGLASQVRRIAEALAALEIRRNEVVAISLPNGPELAVSVLGAACAATAAPLSTTATSFEIGPLLDEARVRAVIVAAGVDLPLHRVAAERGLPVLELVAGERAGEVLPASSHASVAEHPDGSDIALLLHTSGTTSRPKQVPLTHQNLVGATERVVESVRLTADDCCLNVMPLVHAHGLLGGPVLGVRSPARILIEASTESECVALTA